MSWFSRRRRSSELFSPLFVPSETTSGAPEPPIATGATLPVLGVSSHESDGDRSFRSRLDHLQDGNDPTVNNVVVLLLRASEVPNVVAQGRELRFEHMTFHRRRMLLVEANDKLDSDAAALAWFTRAFELTL
jgi:hypothetical protein